MLNADNELLRELWAATGTITTSLQDTGIGRYGRINAFVELYVIYISLNVSSFHCLIFAILSWKWERMFL